MQSRTWGNSSLAAPIARCRELCRLGSGRLASSFSPLFSVWFKTHTHTHTQKAHRFELIGASLCTLQGKGISTYGQVRFRRAYIIPYYGNQGAINSGSCIERTGTPRVLVFQSKLHDELMKCRPTIALVFLQMM